MSSDRGSLTLPLVVADLPDRVVWVPMRTPDAAVRRDLAVAPGAVVRSRLSLAGRSRVSRRRSLGRSPRARRPQLPLTSFGNEPLWLTIGKALFVFVLLVLMTLFTIVVERKVVARMQQRSGPNRVGPGGWGQSLADGLKLAFKEDIIPALADKPVYLLAPVLSAVPAFLAFSVIPFGPTVSVAGNETALQLTDLPVGVLWVLACASLGVYGIVLAGWSSGSTYPLLGGLRSAAQVISYEIAMALALIAVFLYAGSLSTSEIVAAQETAGSSSRCRSRSSSTSSR